MPHVDATGETVAEVLSEGPGFTARLGEGLGRLLQAGDVVCLQGELGTGKTYLTQGIARGWGVRERVTSPTFTLLNEYERASDGARFYHLDCYRLEDADEAWALGLDDVLDARGVLVVEWPERILAALPPERLWVTLQREGKGRRRLLFSASGARYAVLLATLMAEGLAHAAGD
jgi:tRNA threonylcarbamoyladenosine biosynthesis protein TsaE